MYVYYTYISGTVPGFYLGIFGSEGRYSCVFKTLHYCLHHCLSEGGETALKGGRSHPSAALCTLRMNCFSFLLVLLLLDFSKLIREKIISKLTEQAGHSYLAIEFTDSMIIILTSMASVIKIVFPIFVSTHNHISYTLS